MISDNGSSTVLFLKPIGMPMDALFHADDTIFDKVHKVLAALGMESLDGGDDGDDLDSLKQVSMFIVRCSKDSATWSGFDTAAKLAAHRSFWKQDVESLETAIAAIMADLQALLNHLQPHEEFDIYKNRLDRARMVVQNTKRCMYSCRFVHRVLQGQNTGLTMQHGYFDPNPMGDSPHASDNYTLFSYILDSFAHAGFRKSMTGGVMRPVVTKSGVNTHTFEYRGTIAEEVCRILASDNDPTIHMIAVKRVQFEGAIKSVTKLPDPRFRLVEPQSGIYTFESTAIDARDPRNVRIVPISSLDANVVACKFFPDTEAESSWETMDFFNIPTPSFSSIFEYQNIPEDAQRYIFALLGRCMYPLNTYDNWQIIPFFRGKAGTGKSTLLEHVMAKMFAPDDVAFIADECQGFSLAPAVGRRLWIVPEVTARFKLSQADFQQLVSGGALEVRVKHKDSIIINKWTIPGLMAGNQLPLSMSNNSGSLTRRFNVIPFNTSIALGRQDPSLPGRLMVEMPAIIAKITRAYGDMLMKVGDGALRAHMPPFLQNVMEEVSCAFSPLMSFVTCSGRCIVDPALFMPESAFLEAFNSYCRSINVDPPQWNSDLYDDVFSTQGLRIARAGRGSTWMGEPLRASDRVVFGLDLAVNHGNN